MATYIITYDLNSPGQNHAKLLEFIKKHERWARLSESAYAVVSQQTPKGIYDKASPLLDRNDTLYIITLKKPFYGQGPDEVNVWLENNLTI